MPDLKELERLKRRKEQLEQDLGRARGRYDAVLEQLKKEYQCKTPEEAQKLLQQLTWEAEAKRKEADQALENFKRQYGDTLGE